MDHHYYWIYCVDHIFHQMTRSLNTSFKSLVLTSDDKKNVFPISK